MKVRVEFLGTVRLAAGVDHLEVEARTLGEALQQVTARLPDVGRQCLDGWRVRRGYLVAVDGRSFVTDPKLPLHEGSALVLMSADAGG